MRRMVSHTFSGLDLYGHTTHGEISDTELMNSDTKFDSIVSAFKGNKKLREYWRTRYYSSSVIKMIQSDKEFDAIVRYLHRHKRLFKAADSENCIGSCREAMLMDKIASFNTNLAIAVIWLGVVAILSCFTIPLTAVVYAHRYITASLNEVSSVGVGLGVFESISITCILTALFGDSVFSNGYSKLNKSISYRIASKFNRTYESYVQYKMIQSGELSRKYIDDRRDIEYGKTDDSLYITDASEIKNSINMLLSILAMMNQFVESVDYIDTYNKLSTLCDYLKAFEKGEMPEGCDKDTISDILRLCRRYGEILLRSGYAIHKMSDKQDRKKMIIRLFDYIKITVDSVYCSKEDKDESAVLTSLSTIDKLIKLDGIA